MPLPNIVTGGSYTAESLEALAIKLHFENPPSDAFENELVCADAIFRARGSEYNAPVRVLFAMRGPNPPFAPGTPVKCEVELCEGGTLDFGGALYAVSVAGTGATISPIE